jgi:hypothetical protein
MRPIDQDSSGLSYSAEEALAREIVCFEESPPDEAPESPPRAVRSTVGAQVETLETLLATGFDPGGKWESEKDEAEAARLAAHIGDGYAVAVGELIARYGHYCAYCEAAEPTGLAADPLKPANLFPGEAFDAANLLLACPPCRTRKRAFLTRAGGALASAEGPVEPAWPQLYWKGLGSPSPLPFRHRLYESAGGGSADRRAVSPERVRALLAAWREGRFEVETGESHAPRLMLREDGGSVYLAGWVEAGSGRLAGGGVPRQTIDMLDLNCLAGDAGDRRQELRTRAWLTALDLWDRLDAIGRLPEPDEHSREMTEILCDAAIQAVGFWGVWLQVFRDAPGFQLRLGGLMPGTAALPLWET